MKKYFILCASTTLLIGCNSKQQDQESPAEEIIKTTTEPTIDQQLSSKFDVNNIPVSSINIGDFPFFTAPKDAKYINNVKPKDFDFIVFATPDDIFEVEGKTFRAWIHPESGKDISGRYLFKSYEDAILKAGGVKVFEGNLENQRLEEYNQLVTYKGSDGTFIPTGSTKMITYAINHTSGPIYIVYGMDSNNTASIQIVQTAAFQQTIEKITSDQIVDDLVNNGKSILYINFEIDNAAIANDGQELINEIADALKKDMSLKISIEGHTDNTGDPKHNMKLSHNRANNVLAALVEKGIDKTRLSARGYGANKPLINNDTEENKAQNRRVELIKM